MLSGRPQLIRCAADAVKARATEPGVTGPGRAINVKHTGEKQDGKTYDYRQHQGEFRQS